MGKKRTYSTLDGHVEAYEDPQPGRAQVFLKINRHMPKKGKTYFQYYFANSRDKATRDPREPDFYRYQFRIFWNKGEPQLHHHVMVISNNFKNCKESYWEECSKTDDFNLFPDYRTMIERIQSIIAEHYILAGQKRNDDEEEEL